MNINALAYVLFVMAIFVVHFLFFLRHSPHILPKKLFFAGVVGWCVFIAYDRNLASAIWGLLLLCVLTFGYANASAFLRRGITFALIQNHRMPPAERLPDESFIQIRERITEMENHGWIENGAAQVVLTPTGRKTLRIYRFILRVLGAEVVG